MFRPHSHCGFLDGGLVDGVHMAFFHQRAALDHDLVGRGIAQILARRTAQDAGHGIAVCVQIAAATSRGGLAVAASHSSMNGITPSEAQKYKLCRSG
jgi:hypothetical protein